MCVWGGCCVHGYMPADLRERGCVGLSICMHIHECMPPQPQSTPACLLLRRREVRVIYAALKDALETWGGGVPISQQQPEKFYHLFMLVDKNRSGQVRTPVRSPSSVARIIMC